MNLVCVVVVVHSKLEVGKAVNLFFDSPPVWATISITKEPEDSSRYLPIEFVQPEILCTL
jgi:hypothetical protein